MGLKFKKNSCNNKIVPVQTPFTKDVRSFIVESRKCQTLYANCEGYYERRIVEKNDKKTIKDFVIGTIYYKQYSSQEGLSIEKANVVKNLVDKIVSLASSMKNRKIHFTAVWVYYYDYNTHTTKATPLFKIYTSDSNSSAIFMDFKLNVYTSWDHFLDDPNLPPAFMCVPERGMYHKLNDSTVLKLNFFSTIPSLITKNDSVIIGENFASFSQVVVRPWIGRLISPKTSDDETILQKLKIYCISILKKIWSGIKLVGGPFLVLCLRFLMLTYKYKRNQLTFENISKFVCIDVFMMTNTILHYVRNEMETIESGPEISYPCKWPNFMKDFSPFSELFSDITEFILNLGLWYRKTGDITSMELFRIFFNVVGRLAKITAPLLAAYFPHTPVLANLAMNFPKYIDIFDAHNSPTIFGKAVECVTDEVPSETFTYGEVGEDELIECSSSDIRETHEKIISNLEFLENDTYENAFKKELENRKYSQNSNARSFGCSSEDCRLELLGINNKNGDAVFIIDSSSLCDVEGALRRMIGNHFQLILREKFLYEITLFEAKVGCIVMIPPNVFICLLKKDIVKLDKDD